MTRRRDQGYVLASFALLSLPLLALGALLVDLGAADAAQARLEVAAEAAALEGPRGWRSPTDPSWCDGDPDPACDPATVFDAWDAARRARASARVGALFASGDGATARLGPVTTSRLALDSDLGDPSLSARLVRPAAPGAGPPQGPGDPRLEGGDPLAPNPEDRPEGDLVAGIFTGPSAARVPRCGDPERAEPFGENCRYERSDFTPASLAPPAPASRRAMLARLRLTGEAREPGVSAPDARLPVLFGRLADEGLRRRGVAVRATAIADARPALAAGRPGPGLPGAAGVAFELAWWQGLAQAEGAAEEAAALTVVAGTVFEGGVAVGRVLPGAPRAVFVGELVAGGGALAAAPGGEAFAPLYRTLAPGEVRVVAFARAVLEPTASDPVAGVTELAVQKRASAVAAANASAATTVGLAGLPDALVSELFQTYRAGTCDADDPLGLVCAPVRVR